MTANPKSTLGRGKSHKCFKICDEYCSFKIMHLFRDEMGTQVRGCPACFTSRYLKISSSSFG